MRTFWKDPSTVARVAGVLGLCVLVATLTKVLLENEQRRSGTNYVDVSHFFTQVPPGGTICQKELIPKDTGGVRMLLTSYHQATPTLRFRVMTAAGRTVSIGRLRAGWIEGMTTVQIAPIARTTDGRFCIDNDGPAPMTPAGENFDPVNGATVNGEPVAGLMSIQYLRPGAERRIDIAPLVLGRIRHGKSEWFGPWMPVLYLLLVLTCIGGATALAVRR